MSLEELRIIIREEMRKAMLEAFKELVPYVSEEEQAEIDEIAGKPEDYDEDFEELNL